MLSNYKVVKELAVIILKVATNRQLVSKLEQSRAKVVRNDFQRNAIYLFARRLRNTESGTRFVREESLLLKDTQLKGRDAKLMSAPGFIHRFFSTLHCTLGIFRRIIFGYLTESKVILYVLRSRRILLGISIFIFLIWPNYAVPTCVSPVLQIHVKNNKTLSIQKKILAKNSSCIEAGCVMSNINLQKCFVITLSKNVAKYQYLRQG